MLEVRDLIVRYGRREAVHGISFSVGKGELVTLVGANGAGKTTTLKAISGLLPGTRGAISFRGERIDGKAPHAILGRGLAHVPEGRLLFPDMTVLEHLELGALRMQAGGRNQADQLAFVFDLFPVLAERRAQRGGTLSGGQQQMLAVGRGLMSNPSFLMLDEPTLGLAPIIIDTLADTISSLRKAGLTILLVEQRVDMALRLADRGYVIETGRIVLDGTASSLAADPRVQAAYLGT